MSYGRHALAAAFATILLSGCGGDESPTATDTPPPSVERQIAPNATDAAIDVGLDPHVAINPGPSATARGKLFVFLPGTGAVPTEYRLILRAGAARGYHAIGLTYPNPTAVGVLCDGSADPDCHWNVRREIITGIDSSSLVDVSPANSIVNRLCKLLAYLNGLYPKEDWGQYLAGDAPDWSRIEIAGHSQGGGHAAAMAKLYPLDRAVYFSSPADWNESAGAPPAWVSQTSATDPSRQYGFTHARDAVVPIAHLAATWPALGLRGFGDAVSVDTTSAPYGSSHQLVTNVTLAGGDGLFLYHAAPVVDAATPMFSPGVPRFAPVWIYLCFP
jgi:hypothetical protein